ncbi:hypothetical protein ACR92I_19570 [Klebsiella pneumoniae]
MSFKLTKKIPVNITADDGSVLETQEKEFTVTYRVDDISVNHTGTGTAWLQAYINDVTSGQPLAYSIKYLRDGEDIFSQAESQIISLDEYAGAKIV